jgi:hypothetical protein
MDCRLMNRRPIRKLVALFLCLIVSSVEPVFPQTQQPVSSGTSNRVATGTVNQRAVYTSAARLASSGFDYDTTGTNLLTLISGLITGSTLGGRINDPVIESFATNPLPDNGFFKIKVGSGNATSPAWTTSAALVVRGGNWVEGNGRKGSNTSSDWIGTRIAPSNSFPDGIAPPSGAITSHTCTGSTGSFAAGSYLVSSIRLDNLQTYAGTSTILPGQTNAGTEAIVTCPANGTVNFPADTVTFNAAFGSVSALQQYWAPTVNATTTISTTGSSCATTPASCNVAIAVSALTNASWARDFAVGRNVIMDVGAAQETQKVVYIDFANSKVVLAGPIANTHTQPYPIAPSNSETLQNTTSGGAANAAVGCSGTNASNAAFGAMFACTVSSGSNVSVTATLTSGAFNSNAVMPLVNYTAPVMVFGSTGLMGGDEFDGRLKDAQLSCRRPNGTIVKFGLGFVNLNMQEHGFFYGSFSRDCPTEGYVFGNHAQNSSIQMAEFNDGCAAAVTAFGCSGGTSAITNSNYRLVIQAVAPGPLAIERVSSSSANCLNAGCNYTQFAGGVILVDRSQTVVLASHGEAALDVVRVENKGSVTLLNPTGGSSSTSTVLAAFHIASSSASALSMMEIPQGAITGVTDDIFPGTSTTTTGALTAGSTTVIPVSSTTGLYCGQEILLDTVASGVQEYVQIAGYSTAAGTAPATSQCISGLNVTLASAVVNSHSSGAAFKPLSTAVHEGNSIATDRYEVSNVCSGCQNTNRDRWTSYNGAPNITNGPSQYMSSVAGDVPIQIGAGPGVTQTGDLIDIFSDNFSTNVWKVGSNGNVTGTGTYSGPAGSAGSPTYTSTQASNDGIFFPSTTAIGFSPNGTENIRLTTTGLRVASGNGFCGASTITSANDVCGLRAGASIFELSDGGNNSNGFLKNLGAVRVTADQTINASTSLTNITGLSWAIPSTIVLALHFECDILYSQATAVVSDQFGIQGSATMSSGTAAMGQAFTSATAFTAGNVSFTSTTAQSIVTFTPSAITTVWNAHLAGTIVNPVSTANTVNIMAATSSTSDALTIKAGSGCHAWVTSN